MSTPSDDNFYDLVVEPKAGRTLIFTSSLENIHFVERVSKGERFVLSFWFTCDPQKEFEIFLDGKSHVSFSHKIRDQSKRRRPQREL